MNGGAHIAEVLTRAGVKSLFTLCGGHISPILVEAKARGIRVIDVRHEASAVFAADAAARMTGIPGVAAVTAGPGVTNAVTAMKNAQMAQSPVLVLGGATATILKGRGSLQDIDQLALMKPITKWAATVKTLADLGPTVEHALEVATAGVPGPVFVEVPVDLLYPEESVREWYLKESGVQHAKGLGPKALELYLRGHLLRQFHAPRTHYSLPLPRTRTPQPRDGLIAQVRAAIDEAERPVLVLGNQIMAGCREPATLADGVRALGMPTFAAGMARGLLGRRSDIQFRHKRSKALKEADLVLVAGFPFDFRLGYGRSISRKATLIAANLNSAELRKNRRPTLAIHMHPAELLRRLGDGASGTHARWQPWFDQLRAREEEREAEIAAQAGEPGELIHPLALFRRVEEKMDDDAMLVVDGGDFVATAAYTLRPRAPLSWLDPGVFGTLGVGGGFAAGAAACRPGTELWLIYGDGSSAYSLAEFDTFVRHKMSPIAVVGTDASWAQIARDQVDILGDAVGTELLRTEYHSVAEGYGGVGLLLDDPSQIDATLDRAKAEARAGKPVLINVHIRRTDFRKGSLSL